MEKKKKSITKLKIRVIVSVGGTILGRNSDEKKLPKLQNNAKLS